MIGNQIVYALDKFKEESRINQMLTNKLCNNPSYAIYGNVTINFKIILESFQSVKNWCLNKK